MEASTTKRLDDKIKGELLPQKLHNGFQASKPAWKQHQFEEAGRQGGRQTGSRARESGEDGTLNEISKSQAS